MLTAAATLGCLEEALTVIACVSQETLFVLQPANKDEAEAARGRFRAAEGDHVTMMNVYREYMKTRKSSDQKTLKVRVCVCDFVRVDIRIGACAITSSNGISRRS